MSDISEHKAAIVVAAITPTQDRHFFPTVSKVAVQNTSPWRDSGRVVQLAFMCGLGGFGATLASLLHLALVGPEACEPHGGTEFSGWHAARDDTMLQVRLRFRRISVSR